jgi:Type III restriction enzyme, res subunit
MNVAEYYEKYAGRITQDSERMFVEDFLYPLLGSKIEKIIPQYPFLDRTGRSRRIDFAVHGTQAPLALEVNGETYHAEGIIPDTMFDDNLFRQNEILRVGYRLVRFSYSQLKDPKWRPLIADCLRDAIAETAPELLSEYALAPTPLQLEALQALEFYQRANRWQKGVIVMPTGTGKTILSALDAKRFGRKVLFLDALASLTPPCRRCRLPSR